MVTETEDPTQGTPEDEPAESEGTVEDIEEPEAEQAPEPSPEYKGLQRKLQRAQDQLTETEGRLSQLLQQQTYGQQAGVDPLFIQAQNLAAPLYNQKIAQGWSQEQAQEAYALAVQSSYSNLRFQALEQVSARQEAERKTAASARELEQEMREMAQEAGIDPDDAELDYGDTRSPDVVAKMRDFRRSLRDVRQRVERQAPAAARKPPDRSSARVERTEPSGTVGKPDAEAAIRAFEKLNDDITQGRVTDKGKYQRLKELRDKAIAAGAVF